MGQDCRKTIVAVLWEGTVPSVNRIKSRLDCNLEVYSHYYCQTHGITLAQIVERIRSAEVSLIYSMSKEFFEDLLAEIQPYLSECKIVCEGVSASPILNTVEPEIAVRANRYLKEKGDENMFRLFDYLEKTFVGKAGEPLPPVEMPKEALVNLTDGSIMDSLEDYLSECLPPHP